MNDKVKEFLSLEERLNELDSRVQFLVGRLEAEKKNYQALLESVGCSSLEELEKKVADADVEISEMIKEVSVKFDEIAAKVGEIERNSASL